MHLSTIEHLHWTIVLFDIWRNTVEQSRLICWQSNRLFKYAPYYCFWAWRRCQWTPFWKYICYLQPVGALRLRLDSLITMELGILSHCVSNQTVQWKAHSCLCIMIKWLSKLPEHLFEARVFLATILNKDMSTGWTFKLRKPTSTKNPNTARPSGWLKCPSL